MSKDERSVANKVALAGKLSRVANNGKDLALLVKSKTYVCALCELSEWSCTHDCGLQHYIVMDRRRAHDEI
jgi:hypothetical protein